MYVQSMTKSELAALVKMVIMETLQKLRNDLNILVPNTETEYSTMEKVTERFKVTKATVHNWAKRGTIKKYRINGRVLYKLAEIDKVLN